MPPHLKKLDGATVGAISKAMEIAAFKRKRKSVVEILAPHGLSAGRLMIVGIGDPKTLNAREWMEIGGVVRGKLPAKTKEADVMFDGVDSPNGEAPLSFALGFGLKNYAFKKYKSKSGSRSDAEDAEAENERTSPRLTIFSHSAEQLAHGFQKDQALLEGVYFARDLVNEPANILTPPEFVERLRALEGDGLKVEVLDERALKSLGMNAMLAVGQGSAQPTAAVILRWNGVPQNGSEGNLVFIGKGVCFDSGGISIKPSQGMEDMKGDMAGAAAVAGRHDSARSPQSARVRHRPCRPRGEHAKRNGKPPRRYRHIGIGANH